MNKLNAKINALSVGIGQDIKAIKGSIGALTDFRTLAADYTDASISTAIKILHNKITALDTAVDTRITTKVDAAKTDIKSVTDAISAKIGNLDNVHSDITDNGADGDLITMINYVYSTAKSATGGTAGVEIDDTTPSLTKTYSSKKIKDLIKVLTTAIAENKSEIDANTNKLNTHETSIEQLDGSITRVESDLTTAIGTLTSLETTEKGSIVAALNEVLTKAKTAAGAVKINDESNAETDALSAKKIKELIAAAVSAAKSELLDDAPDALNTLKELADALNNDASLGAKVTEIMNGAVRFDKAQSLSEEQINRAQANLGLGEVDFLAAYIAARDGV